MGIVQRLLLLASLLLLGSCTVEFPLSDSDTNDLCPDDPDKTGPGFCGCGVPDGTCYPTINLSKSEYSAGEEIVVNYSGLPGNAQDWVGLFVAGAKNEDYLDFLFSGGKNSGVMKFKGLSEGSYEARLFFDDSYKMEDQFPFTVKK